MEKNRFSLLFSVFSEQRTTAQEARTQRGAQPSRQKWRGGAAERGGSAAASRHQQQAPDTIDTETPQAGTHSTCMHAGHARTYIHTHKIAR